MFTIISQVIARVIVDYKNKLEKNHALINRVTGATSETEQKELIRISSNSQIQATVLPIRSVGVQGNIFFQVILFHFLLFALIYF